MDHKTALLFLVFFFLANQTDAQDTTVSKTDSVYQLSEVVISAYRYKTPILNTASSVTVLTEEDLAKTKKNNLYDILRNEAGVNIVQSGGPGKLTTINIRGGNPSHTLILIDGVEVNMPSDPTTIYDFANLPVSNIERVEILRGPQSTLYGSDAMAGVINIFTKKGDDTPAYYLNAEAGTYKSYSGSAGLSGSLNSFNYNLTLSGMTTGGFSSASEKYGNTEKDEAENKIAGGRLGYSFSDNIILNLVSKFTSADADYDQFGGPGGDDPTYLFNMEETVIRPELKITLGIWEQVIGTSYYRTLRKYSFDSTSAYFAYSNSYYDGKKYKIDWLNNIRLSERNLLSIGIDAEKENAVSNYLEYNSTYIYESSFPESEMNTVGVFLQGNSELFTDAHLSGGLRYDNHNIFGSIVTYRIAPVYYIRNTGTKIKATFGTGFKTPSLFNLYDPTFGNKDLDPEESTGWDLGFEQYFPDENIMLGLTYFSNQYKNLFGSDENFRTININEAETEGLEFYYSYIPVRQVELKLNYTYTKSVDKNPELDESERRLLRRPDHKAGLRLNYKPVEKLSLNLEYIYTGLRKDKDFSSFPAALLDLDPYSLINIAGTYRLKEYLELYTRFENILDEDYEEVYGYGTAGFSVYGGIKFSL
jgi:vitamin B12 transporter